MNIITLFILSLNCVFVVAYTNLALGKTAKASSLESISFKADYAIDGDITTRWGSEERKSNPEWIVVDLGSNIKINKVNIMWESAFARNFEIQVSRNDIDYETVSNVKINREVILDEEAELEDYIQTTTSFATVGARYVRIYCTEKGTLYGYSIYELEIYYINDNVPTTKTGTKSGTITSEPTYTDGGNSDNLGLYFIIIGSSLFLCALLLLAVFFRRRNKKSNDTKKYLEREFKGDYIISPVIPVDPIYEKENKEHFLEGNSNVLNAKEIDITLLNLTNDDNIESRRVNESSANLSNVNSTNVNSSNVNEVSTNLSNVNETNANESIVNGTNLNESVLNESNINEFNNPEVSREVIVQNTPPNAINYNNNLPFITPTTEQLHNSIPMVSEEASSVIPKRIDSYQDQPTAQAELQKRMNSLQSNASSVNSNSVVTPPEQEHSTIPMMSDGVPTVLSKRMEALQDKSNAPIENPLPTYSYVNNPNDSGYLNPNDSGYLNPNDSGYINPNDSGYRRSYNQYMYYPNGDIGMMNMNNGMMMDGMNQPYLMNNTYMNNMNNMNNMNTMNTMNNNNGLYSSNNYGTIPYQNFNNMNGPNMGMNYNNQSVLPSYSTVGSNGNNNTDNDENNNIENNNNNIEKKEKKTC